METKTIDDVEMELTLISAEIGGIHECNNRFTYGLARIIWELGKPIEELTIKELIGLFKQYGETFNRLERIAEESK